MKKGKEIRRAMLLAAGLGTRLLPITEKTPKPLVPVLNVANILYGLFLLKRCGIEEVVLNLHHLPQAIEDYLKDGKPWGMHIEYSREQLLLGTGGGLKKAEAFFNKEPLVLVNCTCPRGLFTLPKASEPMVTIWTLPEAALLAVKLPIWLPL